MVAVSVAQTVCGRVGSFTVPHCVTRLVDCVVGVVAVVPPDAVSPDVVPVAGVPVVVVPPVVVSTVVVLPVVGLPVAVPPAGVPAPVVPPAETPLPGAPSPPPLQDASRAEASVIAARRRTCLSLLLELVAIT
jgi:hypothetical protein